jgi:hypothetical protein
MNRTLEISETRSAPAASGRQDEVSAALEKFTSWLEAYGELSRDHQTFFAGAIGGRAKALYYRHKLLGTAAVAPMILFEALLPGARRFFHHPTRFPIADAHYAMGFAFLYEASSKPAYLDKAIHFLDQLKMSRSAGYKEYCWGYPFDWVTRNGTIKAQTPFITSTPYVWEAFLQVYELGERTGDSEGRGQRAEGGLSNDSLNRAQRLTLNSQPTSQRGNDWKEVLESIARHARFDIEDFETSATASSCAYSPLGESGVINAAAYRAFLLTSASQVFENEDYRRVADRNLNFVLENQNDDGSWFYAVDGVRDFVDHFHTCFVMKALAKIHAITGHQATMAALERGVTYYLANLFDADGLPKPFSKAPRLTVYKRELYDCAECINLCLLLQDRFPQLKPKLETVVDGVLSDWIKPDGSFRSRQLRFGWDNVPMHRWAQSQMFRSLAYYLREVSERRGQTSEVRDQMSEVD